MKRLDQGKVTLVDFLRSIRYSNGKQTRQNTAIECTEHFAGFNPHTRVPAHVDSEDCTLIRSAN